MPARYVIGSGWWYGENSKYKKGSALSRAPKFHEVWKHCVFKYAKPERVIIVDSNAPIKPDKDPREEWVSLDRNYQVGEPVKENNGYNGWMRGFMLGAHYAWACNCSFLYVEQDCLIIGDGIIDAILGLPDDHILVGGIHHEGCKPLPWKLQQSLVFVPYGLIPEFLYKLTTVPKAACEKMFIDAGVPYKTFPFGWGRARPLNLDAPHFYAQHWTDDELRQLARREPICNNLF